ncbi:MAG: Fur family transcriptional regulator [Phycisphaerales bacterium]
MEAERSNADSTKASRGSERPSLERVRVALREHGVRCTRQRELVYTSLAATKSHPTVEGLLATVRVADPGISQATVYNTLDTLVGCGLANRLPARSAGGPCRYDADTSPHVHLTLPDGRVIDAPAEVSDAIMAALHAADPCSIGTDTGRIAGVHIDLAESEA